jgi:hypothetical protein
VFIGVGEGYREVGLVAMRLGCAEVREVVDNLWNARFVWEIEGFCTARCGNLLFHVEHSGAKSMPICGFWDTFEPIDKFSSVIALGVQTNSR